MLNLPGIAANIFDTKIAAQTPMDTQTLKGTPNYKQKWHANKN